MPVIYTLPQCRHIAGTSCTKTHSNNQCKVGWGSCSFWTVLTIFETVDNTCTDVLSAVWNERNHQRQDHGEHRAGATQHPSVVPRITLIGPGGRFVSKKLSGDSAFGSVCKRGGIFGSCI